MKNRLVIAVSGVVCLAALAVAFFVFLWPRFNKDSEEETTAAGTAAATKAPYTATTKTKSANEAPSTMSIFDLGEARLIVTKTERSFDIDVEPVPDVQIYTNPEVGTVVVDGLFMVSEYTERDDFGERRERKTTPGSIYITGVSETSIDLLADYHEEINEGDETTVWMGKVYKAGGMTREQKIKVSLDKEETFITDDGQTITFKYEFDRGPGYEFYKETE